MPLTTPLAVWWDHLDRRGTRETRVTPDHKARLDPKDPLALPVVKALPDRRDPKVLRERQARMALLVRLALRGHRGLLVTLDRRGK